MDYIICFIACKEQMEKKFKYVTFLQNIGRIFVQLDAGEDVLDEKTFVRKAKTDILSCTGNKFMITF